MHIKHITNVQVNYMFCTKFFTKYFTFSQGEYHGTETISFYCKLRTGVRV